MVTRKNNKRPAPRKAAKKVARKSAKKGPLLLPKPPILWRVNTGSQAVGLWVDDRVWAANDRGEIFEIEKSGKNAGTILKSYKLPKPVLCLLADERWRFAGCSNGKVYDLTGRVPRALYEIEGGKQLDWIDMYRGNLCVSDDEGGLTVIGADGDVLWQKRDAGATEGWMVRADESGLWHGSMAGLRRYSWKGKLLLEVDTFADVRFGWPQDDELILLAGYNKRNQSTLYAVNLKGKARLEFDLKARAPGAYEHNGAESCGAARGSDGKLRLFCGGGPRIWCVDGESGDLLWEAVTGMGAPCTMQGEGDLLYVVTTNGTIACLDISDAAIAAAAQGKLPRAKTVKAGKVAAAATQIARTKDASKGVVVECVKEGSKLRVRVVSKGYHGDWFVQFPRDIRENGARFVVDEIVEATQGGFYRVAGDIKRLA